MVITGAACVCARVCVCLCVCIRAHACKCDRKVKYRKSIQYEFVSGSVFFFFFSLRRAIERRRRKEAGVIKIRGQPFFGCQNSAVAHYFL